VNPGASFLAAVIFSSAIATGAFGLTADVGRALVVSSNLRLSSEPETSSEGAIKAFIVPYAGVVRVELQLKSDGTNYAQVDITSQIANCNKFTQSTSYQTFTCNLRVVAGDRVQAQVFGQSLGGGSYSEASIRRMRLFYNVVNSSGVSKILME
jgi:hypothetical protein